MKSKDFLWLSLSLFILLTLAFLLPISPNDYWWYLRLGSETLAQRAIPTLETFTQTQAGQPMVYHSWLSALILFGAYQLGKLPLTFFLRGVVLALTYSLLWKIMRQRGASAPLASLVSFFGILAGSINWAMRPQLFAYPLFVWTLWILLKWNEERDTRDLYLLPFISILWTNLHGSFVLLFLLGGAALIFGKRLTTETQSTQRVLLWRSETKTLAFALVLSLLATLINPRGFGVWIYVKDSLTLISNQAYSYEWMPPVNEGWQMNLFFAWILFFLTVASLRSRSLSPLGAVWMLGFGWLAFSGLRYGIWFLFLLAIFTAELLDDWLRSRPRRGIPAIDVAISAIVLLFPLTLLPGIRETWWADAPPALSAETPVEAAAWLQAHPEIPDPLWAELAYSSYLVYALPERPVWIDTRFEVYPPEDWERYKAISAARWDWESLLEAEGIQSLLLSKATQPALVDAVAQSSNWCRVYQDDDAEIYVRSNAGDFCP